MSLSGIKNYRTGKIAKKYFGFFHKIHSRIRYLFRSEKQGALKELKKGKRKPQKVSVEIRTGRINK